MMKRLKSEKKINTKSEKPKIVFTLLTKEEVEG